MDTPDRTLRVEVFERAWEKSKTRFDRRSGNSSEYPRTFFLNLPPFRRVTPSPDAFVSTAGTAPAPAVLDSSAMKQSESPTDDQDRRIVYDLFELSYPGRMKLFLRLGLVQDEDVDVSDAERVRRALSRARDENKLELLRNELKLELGKK